MFTIPIPALRQRTKPDISRLAGFGRYNSRYSMGSDMSAHGEPQPGRSEMAAVSDKPSVRLDSWKEIASYLMRSERTVRRWEDTEELPVHRQLHEKRGSVYAYTQEADAWRLSRSLPEAERSDLPEEPSLVVSNGDPARMEQGSSAFAATAIASSGSTAGSRRTGTKLWLWSFAVLLGGLIAIYVIRQMPRRALPTLTLEQLTTTPGNEVQPGLSPDGDQVAFAYNGGHPSIYHIFLKTIGSDEPVQLTSDSTNDQTPSWSPDGRNIAFLRFDSDQSARAMLIPSIGGAAREIATIQVSQRQSEVRVAWASDNEWIATSDSETPKSAMSLVLISAITGEKRRLVYKPATVDADLSPSFSPDGRYLAYARHLGPNSADIYLLELPQRGVIAPEARQLTNWNRMNRNPVWTADGQNIIFVGDHSRLGHQIWKIPAFYPGNAVSFNEIGQDSASIALSPRVNRLVYEKAVEDVNIWRIAFDAALSTPGQHRVVSNAPLIASTRLDEAPQYSPDGKYIAFQSDRSGDCEIWIARSDGSSPRQLTRLHAQISGFPRWSPDGKYIAFHSRSKAYGNIYIANVETGDYRKLTTGTTNDVAPTWSHDGKWIYFESEREDGLEIWKVPAAGGNATRLTKNGGAMALESLDGKLLFYSNNAAPGLWVLPLEGGAESQVLPSLYALSSFAMTKKGICFVRRPPDSEAVISYMRFSNRVTIDLASVKSRFGMGLAVSPDERSVLYAQFDRADSDLFLVDNFK
jgi:Tol biopolymer transport system component